MLADNNNECQSQMHKCHYYYYYKYLEFILANQSPGGSHLAKSRSQQQARVTEPSIVQMFRAVLVSVTFCSSMADR